ncbi:MAG: hypothetical protein C5B51_20430 [Terriglobia bacterium]|nr:MAG: hypothetical protein C5B51_20430 [Terriglobia bacterium]
MANVPRFYNSRTAAEIDLSGLRNPQCYNWDAPRYAVLFLCGSGGVAVRAPPKLIIFDLDDTLIDTSRVFFDARESFVRFMIRRGFREDRVRRYFDHAEERNLKRFGYISERNLITMRETYEALTEAGGETFSHKDLQTIASIGSECLYVLPKPLPYARRLLSWCSSRFELALLTRGSEALQNAKIENLGMRDCFELIEVVERKTPEAFRKAIDALGHSPEQCISVGDSMRFDVLCAIEVGIPAIHVTYPHSDIQWNHDKATGVKGKAIYRAATLPDVRAVLESLIT